MFKVDSSAISRAAVKTKKKTTNYAKVKKITADEIIYFFKNNYGVSASPLTTSNWELHQIRFTLGVIR